MKLTKYMRNAFVSAAMNDVPKIDYDEQARAVIEKALDAMFAKVCPGANRHELGNSGWVNRCGVHTPGGLTQPYTACPDYRIIQRNDAKTWAKLEELAAKQSAQSKQRGDLESKLRGCSEACTTRKALADLLPEFEKYLPADTPAAIKTLPAIANVVADFAAAGWPKGSKK